MRDSARAFSYACRVGVADYKAQYTVGTFLASTVQRAIMQVIFFALVGQLLGSRAAIEFLLVGNAVFFGASNAVFAVQNAAWERFTGTLPLLVASPSRAVIAMLGRSTQNLPAALIVAVLPLLCVGALFGVPVDPSGLAASIPVIGLIMLTTYFLAVGVGAIAVRWPTTRNLVANVLGMSLLVLCGVNYPVASMPVFAQAVAQVLPMTHGLQAVRELLHGAALSSVGQHVMLEAMVGLGWLLVTVVTYDWLVERCRRDGSIEFGS